MRNMLHDEVYVASAVRLPCARFQGALSDFSATELGTFAVQAAIQRTGLEPNLVDSVYIGNGWQAGVGQNPARIVALKAGLSQESVAMTLNHRCGSGLAASVTAYRDILLGQAAVAISGGMESTSNVPFALCGTRSGWARGRKSVEDLIEVDGFRCPFTGKLLGELTEKLADEFDISRYQQDDFAATSHERAGRALANGHFNSEIVPVSIHGRSASMLFRADECVRANVSIEALESLQPSFKEGGTITAGNSCSLSDSAAAQLLCSRSALEEYGLRPVARVLDYSMIGCDPLHFGLSPAFAIEKLLKKLNMCVEDVDLLEINEAFALQYIACERHLRLDREKVNTRGGSIALGHPVAASGSRILTTLIHALRENKKEIGIASVGISGGQGIAIAVQAIA